MHLFSGNVLVTATMISVLAILSKVIGCGLPLLSEGWLSVFRVGVGMMPRGEVALIVAAVGLRSEIVLPSTYAIVVFMTAVTTLIAPPLLRYLFRQGVEATRRKLYACGCPVIIPVSIAKEIAKEKSCPFQGESCW